MAEESNGIDTTRPSVSRVYDFLLGGKDNFAIDRQVAQMVLKIAPDAPDAAFANRGFLRRVIHHLTAEAGVRQFLDIGSGLPTQGNVHEVAQAVDPEARVVYVDHDPIVLAHGRALLATNDTTTVIEADIRDPRSILDHPDTKRLIDFSRPVGLLLFSILHHINDDEDPEGLAAQFRDVLAPGSFMAISHFQNPGDAHPEAAAHAANAEILFNENLGTGRWRTKEEILAYFGDMEVLEPGLVPLAEWRAEPDAYIFSGITYHTYVGGLARKA
ncbi:SAM-dependent methyltransferase [Acrocarpospora phusangensis]|uniref:SAM-dependent methyltransferase n=1 Tax=Acrocarpospora phusangensis TaxID=1070424 RepID=A0A919ULK3_9ACTN|nr:SAM-dependent methyltransferase [Acrocarpospora phusangensis]GIH22383.1 SAM-dependent methyltransferase [Acrocarpospora phusangensis]